MFHTVKVYLAKIK